MQLAQPHPDCSIVAQDGYLRAYVGSAPAEQVMECYRSTAVFTLEQKFTRVLVVGAAAGDPMPHMAARDAVIALSVIGVPAGFKLALVALSHESLNGYRHAEIEAARRGIRVKVLAQEDEAVRWLMEPDRH